MKRKMTGLILASAALAVTVAVSAQYLPTFSKRAFSAPRATQSRPITQLIVKYRDETTATHKTTLASTRITALKTAAGQPLIYKRSMSGLAHVLYLPQAMSAADARAEAERLSQDPAIEYAVPDYVRMPLAAPDDPGYTTGFTYGSGTTTGREGQWNLYAPTEPYTYAPYGGAATIINPLGGANVPAAWALSSGAGVVVAVIDTGVTSHPDLNANLVGGSAATSGYDFISGNVYDGDTDPNFSNPNFTANDGDARDADPSDPGDHVGVGECGTSKGSPVPAHEESSTWHGSHVTGVIAAVTNNKLGVAGIAHGSKVLALRALGRCGGSDSDIIDAVRWAAGIAISGAPANANPARVINMSIGGSVASGPDICSAAFQSAVNDVRARGLVVVAATGNDGKTNIAAPSSCAGVIAVTAHTVEGDNASYANIGDSGDGTATKAATNAATISAPGGGSCALVGNCSDNYVWSTVNRGRTDPDISATGPTYGGSAGTSMATPHVAAAAALLIAMDPGLNSDRVQSVLTATARAFPAGSYCAGGAAGANKCGAGLLDVTAAVTELSLRLPTVNAGAAQSVFTDATASLAGTASVGSHSAGSSLTYQWTQIGGAAVSLATPKAPTTTFTAPAAADTLSFKLTVTDSRGYTGSATTSVTVTAAPAGGGGGGGGGAVDWLVLLALGAFATFSGLTRRRAARRH